jgi:DNA processing protein
MEQGREVFAIPGSIHNPLARGCHALIRQGAKLVETAGDILEELGPLIASIRAQDHEKPPSHGDDQGNPEQSQQVIDALPSPEHKQLYAQLGYEPISVDTLVARSQLTAEAVSAMLVELELRGCVTSYSGMYSRTH